MGKSRGKTKEKKKGKKFSNGDTLVTAPKGARPKKDLNENTATFKKASTSLEYRRLLMNARLAKSWKQKDLAQRLCVSVQEIQRWESGKVVPPGNIRGKLNRILNVKLPKIQKARNNE